LIQSNFHSLIVLFCLHLDVFFVRFLQGDTHNGLTYRGSM
jgi:hypothetical protein